MSYLQKALIMKIIIDDSALISEIQEEFNKHFPFLKLIFFNYDPISVSTFTHKNMIMDTHDLFIGDIRHLHNIGEIHINGHEKVETLEQEFSDNFGINIQVFRKSGDKWLLTSSTDKWSLSEQNKRGEEMSKIIREDVVDFDQYHEHE
jgi:hypothetical protein